MSDSPEVGLPEVDHYPNVVRFVAETPWALLPSTLAAITDFIRLRSEGHRLSEAEIQARIGGGPGTGELRTEGGVAVVPLYGVVTPRATLLSQISGGSSLESFKAQMTAAVNDPGVKAVVIDVNSPGGSTYGLTEAAAAIREMRGSKPIVAVANHLMASAAYQLGAQADEVVASPSSLVGSIGTYATHEDLTAAAEKAGIKTTLISAGKFKTEGNPFVPLTRDAMAAMQRMVDDTYADFVNDVAVARNVSADTVRNGYGEGRVLTARDALKAGMVDRIATLEETVARLSSRAGRRGSSFGSYAKAQRALPALRAECSREDALYSMALLMGGRGAAAFTDLPDVDHRELYDVVAEAYAQHGLEPPEYARDPDYSNVAFRQDERGVFADRYLRKNLATVTAGVAGFKGQLSPETADAAQAAVRELTALLGGRSSSPEPSAVLTDALAELRRATDLLKGV